MAFLLSCQSLTKSFGARALFNGITIGIDEGERLGLIGPNGAGKSTLLRILAGQEKPDDGEVSARRGLHVGYVAQTDEFAPGATTLSALTDALQSTGMDEHERELQASVLLARIGFTADPQPVDTLSGGWRKRLAIARELIREPDVLFLDEPTNHLDLEGILWLEELLRNAPFAVVAVTHDRYFLENATNRIVELNRAYAEGYLSVNGPYSAFLEEREAYLAGQLHQQTALESNVRREIDWLRRNPQARTTKAEGRIREAHRLIDELAEVRYRNAQDKAVDIDFAASGRKTRELITAKKLSINLGGRTLFANLDMRLAPGMKLGLIGANGAGKTTLLRMLMDQLSPSSGEIRHAEGLRTVYFDQNRAPLNPNDRLRDALSPNGDTVVYRGKSFHVAGWARRFLFRPEQIDQQVSALSGGEQARILMANMMLQPADLLILDEPTNDLDIPSLEVLEESLREFPGALVLVSHDRYLLDRVCTELLALDGNGTASYLAEYSQWERLREEKQAQNALKPAVAPRAKPVRLTTQEKRDWDNMEEMIMTAEARVEELEGMLADPTVTTDAAKLQQTWQDHAAAKDRVTALYARWEELEAKVQAINNRG